MTIREIISYLESVAPPAYQESYDNAGLIIGDPESTVTSALITLDVTEAIIDEAIETGCELIISHHPILFKGIKRLNGNSFVERCVIKAIKNNIAIFAAHTNLDSILGGVNSKICEKIGLTNTIILAPAKDQLLKLVTFIPKDHLDKVREAVFAAGAGEIGKYDKCSFSTEGLGTFRGGDDTNAYVGEKGEFHFEKEARFETILHKHSKNSVINALLKAHPYEEVAYDLYPLENTLPEVGAGMIGELPGAENEIDFLSRLLDIFGCKSIRHTYLLGKSVKKVAVCGGSGSFLLPAAIAAGADIFVTADMKYHDFFEAEEKIIVADIGHYESEQFTKELFYEILIKKFPNFALRLSEVKSNPVLYLCQR
ncbi:MAG TPA: Nif3-like dinuclear metal center hexameric protein [Prolixibacteraceae bacterium]|nr:Nif3-like dinuclear metal center hexameric protein [Prolixibacteraceae bacterium]